jgi:putative permease
MMQMARDWYRQYFADPEAIILLLTLLVLIGIFWLFGAMLAPVLVSIVLAYLLNSIVKALERVKFPHVLAVSIV